MLLQSTIYRCVQGVLYHDAFVAVESMYVVTKSQAESLAMKLKL